MAKKHECLRWFAPPQNEMTENNLPTYLTDGLPPYLRHYLVPTQLVENRLFHNFLEPLLGFFQF